MQLWKSINSIFFGVALAACVRVPGALVVRSASIDAGVLSARLDWQPDRSVLAALDHGIALDFVVHVRALDTAMLGWRRTLGVSERHLELRYFPLSRQYQWHDLDHGETRNYASRALLLAALEDLRVPVPDFDAHGARAFALDIALDRGALPGALRVPALLRRAWHVDGDYSWSVPAG